MQISLVQVASPADEPVAARRERVGALVATAAGSDLVVLPELWAPGYFAFDRYEERAEPIDGPTVAAGRRWARDLGCHVALGSIVERSAEGLHNTAIVIGPSGDVVHTYRKVHVFSYRSREAELLTPGADAGTFGTPWGTFGATTCYDLRFPELYRRLVDAGAQTVVVPAAWPASRLEHWRLFTTTRAVEQQVVLVACNAVGVQYGTALAGHSRVVDPWGRVLVEADDREGVVTCRVDPRHVDAVRAEFPALADRRLGSPRPRTTGGPVDTAPEASTPAGPLPAAGN
jgi:predicted amidohydrolase